MKIIKRNGSEAVFDITKIISAITKANKVVPEAQRLTKQQIIEISDHVQEVCYNRSHAMNVEEIQDLVEDAIMATGAYEVARRYITYRYVQSLKRTHNTTDDKILSLIECNNEEVKQENSNKNPTVNSVQRDYMAGEVSKDSIDRIFERFYRVDKSRSKAVGGTGLGLSIVKHAALIEKADVRVESEPGDGSAFTVTFPANAQ